MELIPGKLANNQEVKKQNISDKEKKILQLLAQGCSNESIARELGISRVDNRLLIIGHKIGIENTGTGARQRIAEKAREIGLVPEIETVESKLYNPLFPSEIGVLNMMAENSGVSNKEIALQLGISMKTVEKHLENIFNKLGCDNRYQAVLFFKRLIKGRVIPGLEQDSETVK